MAPLAAARDSDSDIAAMLGKATLACIRRRLPLTLDMPPETSMEQPRANADPRRFPWHTDGAIIPQ
jgi:hypothetical protein